MTTTADGRGLRWREHRLTRRAEFVDAALRALSSKGPDVSIADIAAEAKVAKPRLYRHFADKADIIGAVGERLWGAVVQRLTAAFDPAEPPAVIVRRGLAAFLAVVDEHPHAFLALIRPDVNGAGGAERLLAETAKVADVVTAVLAGQLELAGVEPAGAEPWGHALAGAVGGATTWWLEHRLIGKDALADVLSLVVLGALAGILRDHGVELDLEQPIESSVNQGAV